MRKSHLVLVTLLWLTSAQSVFAQAPNLSGLLAPLNGQYPLTSADGCGRYTEAAALILHGADASYGHLRKPASRSHVVDSAGNLHAVDVVLYRTSGQIVDLVSDCGGDGAHPSWSVGAPGEYSESDWYAPVGSAPAPAGGASGGGAGTPAASGDLGTLLDLVRELHIKADNNDAANERQYQDLAAKINLLATRVEILVARPIPSTPIVMPNPTIPAVVTAVGGTSAWDIIERILIVLGPAISAVGATR